MATAPQQINPEVLAAQQPTPTAIDPEAAAQSSVISILQAMAPGIFSRPANIQSPFGGFGQMSMIQRPMSIDPFSVGMNIPNMLMGTNYPTTLPQGYHVPQPGQTWEDVQRNQNAYRQFAEYNFQAGETSRMHVMRSIDSLSNIAGFGNVMYDERGQLTKIGETLSSQAMAPIMNQLASSFGGGPGMDAMNAVWQQRGQLGYNIARGEGRARGMAPMEEDNAAARKLSEALNDVMFERDTRGGYNMFTRRAENMYGFSPDQIYKMASVAVQGGAALQKPEDITRMLSSASAVTAFTGNDTQGVQDAINSMARQGMFNMDTAQSERVTATLRGMAKNLKELNMSQEQMKEIYKEADTLATAAGSGISGVLHDPVTGAARAAGYQATSVAAIGMAMSRLAPDIGAMQVGLVAAGRAGRELAPDEQGQMGRKVIERIQTSEFFNLGKYLATRTDPGGEALRARYAEIAQSGDSEAAQRFTREMETASRYGRGAFEAGSTAMEAISPVYQKMITPEAEAGLMQQAARVMTGERQMDISWQRGMKAQASYMALSQLSGGLLPGVSGNEARGAGLTSVVAQLRKAGRAVEADALEGVRKGEGGDEEAFRYYNQYLAQDGNMVTAFSEGQAGAYEAALKLSPDQVQAIRKQKEAGAVEGAIYTRHDAKAKAWQERWRAGQQEEVIKEYMATSGGALARAQVDTVMGRLQRQFAQGPTGAEAARIDDVAAAQRTGEVVSDATTIAAGIAGAAGAGVAGANMEDIVKLGSGKALDVGEWGKQRSDIMVRWNQEREWRYVMSRGGAQNRAMRLLFDWSTASMGESSVKLWYDKMTTEQKTQFDSLPAGPEKTRMIRDFAKSHVDNLIKEEEKSSGKALSDKEKETLYKTVDTEGIIDPRRLPEAFGGMSDEEKKVMAQEAGAPVLAEFTPQDASVYNQAPTTVSLTPTKKAGAVAPTLTAKADTQPAAAAAAAARGAAAGASETVVRITLDKNLMLADDVREMGSRVTTRGKDIFVRSGAIVA